MGSVPPELSLGCKPASDSTTITGFLHGISTIESVSDRVSKIDDYIRRLEEEMRKIDAFKRELPLCMLLLNDAIISLKEEAAKYRTARVEPVLEEFIPLKKCSNDGDDGGDRIDIRKDREKMNWMSSAVLWNGENLSTNNKHHPEPELKTTTEEAEYSSITNDVTIPCKTGNTANGFIPFKSYSGFPTTIVRKQENKKESPNLPPDLMLGAPVFKSPREDLGMIGCCSNKNMSNSNITKAASSCTSAVSSMHSSSSRKERRCWTPDLHKSFINALQQLGGAQVATPKQIRELMQVDGLTNDEVKSHLQKYRLHTRKLPQSTSPNQSVVVLGNLFLGHRHHFREPAKQQSSHESGSPESPLCPRDDGIEEADY
ncbi:unnamed protein product [Cuscuta epithymum]|uniref:HTH myb-type domain-containing protein n=1 Tax=Cuscuta epithymum TaxID=186058 RepID=A0AAV0CKD1_9ASTE|nr:unnamed protein product [Cuscuta epithymum]